MKNKFRYLFVLILILIGMYQTRIQGIDGDTMSFIERAKILDDENEWWPDYALFDYPMEINYGEVEFRYENGKVIKQKPKIPVLALSAVRDEKGPVLKLLPFQTVRALVDIMGDVDREEREEIYLSILFHEGLHAFQLSQGVLFEQQDLSRYRQCFALLKELDDDREYQRLWQEEQKALIQFYENKDKNLWIDRQKERWDYLKEKLGEDFSLFCEFEAEREYLEGTARYVEEKVLSHVQKRQEKMGPGDYIKGDEKYYRSGRLKCLILDENIRWKEDFFQQNKNLDQLLVELP
ncbi:MAG: hypothetical protein Q4P28_03810 [Tissierellia bacterium]|nr:hypothetical protein [Tissierellia bacterium]